MGLKSGQQWTGLIVCKDATGALSTPSAGPVGALYVNGVLNGASVTVSGSNPYKWTVTLPALSAGDLVSMYVTATIDDVATAEVVAEDVADTYRTSDIEELVDDIGVAGAGLTAIPWNAAWDAEVESEATDALNAYDPPTNAEMEARTLAAASAATLAASAAAHAASLAASLSALAASLSAFVASSRRNISIWSRTRRSSGRTASKMCSTCSAHQAWKCLPSRSSGMANDITQSASSKPLLFRTVKRSKGSLSALVLPRAARSFFQPDSHGEAARIAASVVVDL